MEMPTRRPKMRHVREVVRMHREARVPMRKIARLTGLTRPTVRDMVVRFERSGLESPGPSKIGDINLEEACMAPWAPNLGGVSCPSRIGRW
ncbi:helix-turn-helix domain-containing protein [Novosphingobium resinovorum]